MSSEQEYFEANRAHWDERAKIHPGTEFYDVAGFKAGRDCIRPCERAEVGDVAGKTLVHLQCHFGLDTLSWARTGARVTGLDFSPSAVATARELAAELGIAADFHEANVYDAVEALGGRQFDIVYTGLGAIIWLPDIERWARVVAALVKPGGFLYLSEFHPFHSVLGDDDLVATYDYFRGKDQPFRWDEPGTYADLAAPTESNVSYEWPHPLGSVVSAVIAAGLRLEFLHEFDYTLWQRWPFLEQDGDVYRMPAGKPRLPLMYSLKASRPG